MLLTDLGSHPEFPWYGTTIVEDVGDKLLTRRKLTILSSVQETFEKFVTLQSKQAGFQQLSDGERVDRIVGVNVDDRRETVFVVVRMLSRAGNLSEIRQGFLDSAGTFDASGA